MVVNGIYQADSAGTAATSQKKVDAGKISLPFGAVLIP